MNVKFSNVFLIIWGVILHFFQTEVTRHKVTTATHERLHLRSDRRVAGVRGAGECALFLKLEGRVGQKTIGYNLGLK